MSMGSLKNKIGIGIFALSVLACTESSNSIPPDFVRLYGDLRIAAREFGETSTDGRIARIQIFKQYGYTVERFDSIAEKIQRNADLWEPFQEAVVEYVDSVAVGAGAIAPQVKNVPLPKSKDGKTKGGKK